MKKKIIYKEQICSICGRTLIDNGNNSEPICEGRCCNECNSGVVIPVRIKLSNNK